MPLLATQQQLFLAAPAESVCWLARPWQRGSGAVRLGLMRQHRLDARRPRLHPGQPHHRDKRPAARHDSTFSRFVTMSNHADQASRQGS